MGQNKLPYLKSGSKVISTSFLTNILVSWDIFNLISKTVILISLVKKQSHENVLKQWLVIDHCESRTSFKNTFPLACQQLIDKYIIPFIYAARLVYSK